MSSIEKEMLGLCNTLRSRPDVLDSFFQRSAESRLADRETLRVAVEEMSDDEIAAMDGLLTLGKFFLIMATDNRVSFDTTK